MCIGGGGSSEVTLAFTSRSLRLKNSGHFLSRSHLEAVHFGARLISVTSRKVFWSSPDPIVLTVFRVSTDVSLAASWMRRRWNCRKSASAFSSSSTNSRYRPERAGTERGKQPYLLALADGSPLSFAVLWERWSRDGESLESFSIITTAASPTLADIRHRQPAIVHLGRSAEWLNLTSPAPRLLDLVREPHGGPYERRAVSTRVNSVRHDDPGILAPRSELELFWREAEIGVNCQDRRFLDRQGNWGQNDFRTGNLAIRPLTLLRLYK